MLSRRLLRVKVMQMVYAYYKTGDTTVQKVEKELFHSIAKSSELYHLYLLLLLELKNQEEKRIDLGMKKRVPTYEDLHPNSRFVDNIFINLLANNNALLRYIEQHGVSWTNYPEVIKQVLGIVRDSTIYKEYMATPSVDFDHDRKFIAKLIEKVIAPCEDLYAHFEEQSIYWNDEAEFILSMVIKTVKEFDAEKVDNQPLLPEFRDEEDREFVKTLFRKSILNEKEFRSLIDQHTKNWDIERVAFIDIVLMQIALAEITEFVNIPVKVTLNEYIEIAKHYSTAKSGVFINGVLDKVVDTLTESNKIFKTGKQVKGEA
jgi:transcription antitermination protein NusB